MSHMHSLKVHRATFPQRTHRAAVVVALLLGALAVPLDELVLWSGQPAGDPTSAQVSAWYESHASSVLIGDALWLLACGALAVGFWSVAARFQTRTRRVVRVAGTAAASALALAAVLAAGLALQTSADSATLWSYEGRAYELGLVLTVAGVVAVVVGAVRTAPLVAIAAAGAGLLVLVPSTAMFGLVAVLLLLAVLVSTTGETADEARPAPGSASPSSPEQPSTPR